MTFIVRLNWGNYPEKYKPFQNCELFWLFEQSFQSNFHHDINFVSGIVCKISKSLTSDTCTVYFQNLVSVAILQFDFAA